MVKRTLTVDWATRPGASKKRRKISLMQENGLFLCPVSTCLKSPYGSDRGAKKHIIR